MERTSLFSLGAYNVEPIRYYSYTSSVVDRIIELDRHDEEAEEFWKELIEKAQKKLESTKYLDDNKCAFEVVYAGHTFFVGVYDQKFSIGLGLRSFSHAGNCVLELIPGSKYSEYGERRVGTCASRK
jgi:hypothetical protein